MEFYAKSFDELTTKELYEILKARCGVFTVEQQMNCQDMDDTDYRSVHFYLWENQKVVGYFRAFFADEQEGIIQVGRCLTVEHGKGIGKALMNRGLDWLKKTYHPQKFVLHAQKQAIGFYEKLGFSCVSEDYWEEGILHRTMELKYQ